MKVNQLEKRLLAEALVCRAEHDLNTSMEKLLDEICVGIISLSDRQKAEVIRIAGKVNPRINNSYRGGIYT